MKKITYAVIVSSLVGILTGLAFILYFYDMDTKSLIIAKIVFSTFIVLSIFIAAMQFRLNRKQAEITNKWNKKQSAITQMHASRKVMKEAIIKLHSTFGILERKDPYELYEIHDIYGVMLKNGKFCFHGEQTEEDIKQLPDTQTDDEYRCISFRNDINGREMKDAVINYLSEYEYICSAVNNDIFDDKTVKSLLKGSIVGKYKLFEKYIKHQQESTGNETYFAEFASVAKRYAEE
ncbi:DUF4760 domain-containing protein [Sulfurovum sp.]|uniref:DUF4760 domain-containing protein n=1 Tax=Sulfurovum sp. TaxID=1969726 RepID=UPI0025F6C309|nr:DUF4760 domain-containing protein [Sulfurovum sp.]